MGFWSAVGSFCSSCWSAVCSIGSAIGSAASSLVSGAGSFVSGCISTVGSALASFATGTLSVLLGSSVEIAVAVAVINEVLNAVGKLLGGDEEIALEEIPLDELGFRASVSDKRPEDFANSARYLEHLAKYQQYHDKFKQLSAEQRLGCQALGLGIKSNYIAEKLGVKITPQSLGTLAKIEAARYGLTNLSEQSQPAVERQLQTAQASIDTRDAPALVALVQALKAQGVTDMNDVSDLIEGVGTSDRAKTGEAVVQALGENGADRLRAWKDACRSQDEL